MYFVYILVCLQTPRNIGYPIFNVLGALLLFSEVALRGTAGNTIQRDSFCLAE